jgi:hypothetical protein
VWFDPTEEEPDRCTIFWGPESWHLTEAQWRDQVTAADAGFATIPAQRAQHAETQAMLRAAKTTAERRQDTGKVTL